MSWEHPEQDREEIALLTEAQERIRKLEAEKESWGNEFNAVIALKDQLARQTIALEWAQTVCNSLRPSVFGAVRWDDTPVHRALKLAQESPAGVMKAGPVPTQTAVVCPKCASHADCCGQARNECWDKENTPAPETEVYEAGKVAAKGLRKEEHINLYVNGFVAGTAWKALQAPVVGQCSYCGSASPRLEMETTFDDEKVSKG